MASGPAQYDPDEMDRAAQALTRSQAGLSEHARAIRSATQQLTRFRSAEADRFKASLEDSAKAVDRLAQTVDAQARSLKRLAQDVRNLRIG